MSVNPATVRVVATEPELQGPFVIINERDFDEAVHTLYVDPLDHDRDGEPGGSEPGHGLTKSEIIADLEAMAVPYDPRAVKAELLALRNAARAERDAAPVPEAVNPASADG
jgi:hypothetical protein